MYNLSQPDGGRVVSASVACEDRSGEMCPLDDDKVYYVAAGNYLIDGNDDFTMIKNNKTYHGQGRLDTDVMRDYLAQNSPLHSHVAGRLAFFYFYYFWFFIIFILGYLLATARS